MKFGGSCLVNDKAFNKIYEITKIYDKSKKVYVASALNGITDLLIKTAQNVNNLEEVDSNMALIEKRHIKIIEEILDENDTHYRNAKDWVDIKLSELEDTFSDIREFGFEPYYKDYVMSF
jgi:aspartokinase/homoserine dehydrogenase 1